MKKAFLAILLLFTLDGLCFGQNIVCKAIPIKLKNFNISSLQKAKLIAGYISVHDSVTRSNEAADSLFWKRGYLVYPILTKGIGLRKRGVYYMKMNSRHRDLEVYFIRTRDDVVIIKSFDDMYLAQNITPILKKIGIKEKRIAKIYNSFQ